MTIEEFLAQGVDDLRLGLQNIFEDPAGEFVEMRKPALLTFAKNNQDTIEEYLAVSEAEPEPELPEDEGEPELKSDEVLPGVKAEELPLDPEPESTTDESAATPGWEGNPATNLHSGAPGNVKQREGTRDLA